MQMANDLTVNEKLKILLEEYEAVKPDVEPSVDNLKKFIQDVCAISKQVRSDSWNGEDVMAIFFNEFNRYRGKSDAGQVFTPDHITSFMYRLLNIHQYDRVLDATCGSGAFLVKAMCNMMREAGGQSSEGAKRIKTKQLYGIEMYSKVFVLACANMLIHKDGKTNLMQLDASTPAAAEWIREKNITKVLMNPPYERKYGCLKIVANVLDSVPVGTECAFILPDKKLEKDFTDKKFGNKLLKNHTLKTIVKLPENLFFGIGVTTSIFVFISGRPQDGRNIIGYYIEDDGLETVKNQGRMDVKERWPEIEDYWINAIRDVEDTRHHTKQIINPMEHLSYQMPEKLFEIFEEDFVKTVMDYELFRRGIDVKEFNEKLIQKVLYGSQVTDVTGGINVFLGRCEVHD